MPCACASCPCASCPCASCPCASCPCASWRCVLTVCVWSVCALSVCILSVSVACLCLDSLLSVCHCLCVTVCLTLSAFHCMSPTWYVSMSLNVYDCTHQCVSHCKSLSICQPFSAFFKHIYICLHAHTHVHLLIIYTMPAYITYTCLHIHQYLIYMHTCTHVYVHMCMHTYTSVPPPYPPAKGEGSKKAERGSFEKMGGGTKHKISLVFIPKCYALAFNSIYSASLDLLESAQPLPRGAVL